ncbi:hypothetical protein ACP4OV_029608 [Aristida adscensionis]
MEHQSSQREEMLDPLRRRAFVAARDLAKLTMMGKKVSYNYAEFISSESMVASKSGKKYLPIGELRAGTLCIAVCSGIPLKKFHGFWI